MTFPLLDAAWQPPMVGQSKVGANSQAVLRRLIALAGR